MTIYDGIFPLGLGTNRFRLAGAADEKGLDECAELVLEAINLGISYIDTSYIYSRGMAHAILKRAFAQTTKQFAVTLKSQLSVDGTADAVRKRAESSLMRMGISRAAYFMVWTIMSYSEFEKIMSKDGVYEGALRLKNEGIVDHICFSTHAPVFDIIRILKSGAFEGMTVSFSLLNCQIMQPVLLTAHELNVGVVAMNPFGGGIIPQNKDYFAFAKNKSGESVPQAAIRFVAAHPAIKIVLAGISSKEELHENFAALSDMDSEPREERITRVSAEIQQLKSFCTGCGYCDKCPQELPVSAIMYSRNSLLFEPVSTHNRFEHELLRNIHFLGKLSLDYSFLPEKSKNPCVRCGECESKCTQRLEICNALEDSFRRMELSGFSVFARRNRLDLLTNAKKRKIVGFYPGGVYTSKVIELYYSFFGEPDFEIFLFDSSPSQWGTYNNGLLIYPPNEILSIKPDCIIISNYKYNDEIYDGLKNTVGHDIEILKLHEKDDVPWLF